ncbi:DsbA family protein [Domibacillus sp. PGB-M46]|uniref:DsbA family protein n=1 Tax=Domibacillus sp. PGB-M46 TaxID=2910255 RepID=UPI001F561391|nr:thioredoxin domain-containing protein [Domibacillus sp. PGB-M46]MCI2252836.1 DsbA family protein [Domibacillus sp. PGB-M46]
MKSLAKGVFWIVGFFAICMAGVVFLSNVSEKSAEINYEKEPFLGKEEAPVSIVEFGDYKCPVCKDFNESFFPLINEQLVETGKAKFYFMNYSFINVDSNRSAQFAEAVYQTLGNDRFWKFHHLMYEKQPDDLSFEKVDLYTNDFLKETLSEIATDEEVAKVMAVVEKEGSMAAWEKDAETAKELQVSGTPTLFVNGKKFEGNSFDDLVKMVDEAAADAE